MNDITKLLSPIVAKEALLSLRANVVLPKLIGHDYDAQLQASRGDTVTVNIANAFEVFDVVPGTPTQNNDVAPEKVDIKIDKWKSVPFGMSDKEMAELKGGHVPDCITEATSALADFVDMSIINLYQDIPNFFGIAGTPPSTASDIVGVYEILNQNKVPRSSRSLVIDTKAEANLIKNKDITSYNATGDGSPIISGRMTPLFGFDPVVSDQNIAKGRAGYHIAGTLGQHSSKTATVNGAVASGLKKMNIDGSTAAKTIKKGDLFVIAGVSDKSYVVTSDLITLDGSGVATNLEFHPAAPTEGIADNSTITFLDSHLNNLAFHKNWATMVVRQFTPISKDLGVIVYDEYDPISGLNLRLKVSHANNQTIWDLQILFGIKVIRSQLCARLIG